MVRRCHSKRKCCLSFLIHSSYAIPLVAFSYTGIEIIAMTAFEARDAAALRWPSRWIGSTVFLLYFLCTIGEALNVKWNNPHLPYIYGGAGNKTTATPNNPRSTSLLINAAWGAGYPTMASILNGCLIFSVLSASNTSLYVSSRTLYGLTREIPDTNWFNRQIRWLSLVAKGTGVPAASLLFSAVSFFWLPFLQLKKGYALEEVSVLHLAPFVSHHQWELTMRVAY
jgi:amino acid transporter